LAARRPDIVVIDKQTKIAQIIDVAVPADNNVSMKEKEKIEKYKDLCVELLSLWRVHCKVIPLIIGGLGCVTNMLQGYLLNIINEDENGIDHANFRVFKKMVLSIAIHLKLAKRCIGNLNILVRYLIRMWLFA